MILELIWLIVLFGIFWVVAAIVHELFHGLACWVQNCKFKIEFWWYELNKKIKIPSMMCTTIGTLKNNSLFNYLGGIGTGFSFGIVSVIVYFIYQPIFIVLFIIGMMHFFYGIFEGMFADDEDMSFDEYMWMHYLVYFCGFVIGTAMMMEPIRSYVIGVI